MDLREIYDRQFNRVYRIAMMYLENVTDAEDVTQTVFLKYIEKNIIFNDREHEKAWFITVTRNQCLDVLKSFWKKKMDYELPLDLKAEENEDSGLIYYILKLPDKYREVLYLYYFEEFSVKEMSKILNRNESTIQTQLSSARSRLKKILQEGGQWNEFSKR